MAVLPHYSPGYPEWDIAEQPRLLDLISRRGRDVPVPTRGAGLRHAAAEEIAAGRLRPDAPHRSRAPADRSGARARTARSAVPVPPRAVPPRDRGRAAELPHRRATPTSTRARSRRAATASTQSAAALGRRAADARTSATTARSTRVFRYEGTTCTNMGRPLQFRLSRDAGTARGRLSDSANSTARRRRATTATRPCAAT